MGSACKRGPGGPRYSRAGARRYKSCSINTASPDHADFLTRRNRVNRSQYHRNHPSRRSGITALKLHRTPVPAGTRSTNKRLAGPPSRSISDILFLVPSKRRPVRFAVVVILAALALFLLSRAGSFLVVDDPQPSDAMVILEGSGDTPGYGRAASLVQQGYAKVVILDANVSKTLYGRSEAELAAEFLKRTGQYDTQICPVLSTGVFNEANDVKQCLHRIGARSAVLMTSDFETRRTLDIFQKRLPQYRWSVAAASTPYHFAEAYWKHRGWAKTVVVEWEEYLWWKLYEQWRKDVVLH